MEIPDRYFGLDPDDMLELINLAGGQTIMEIQTTKIGRLRFVELPNANKYIIRYKMDGAGCFRVKSVEKAI